jgi:hypothetical protein
VPLKTYDETLSVLRKSLAAAKLGNGERIDGFKRLDKFVRAIETNHAPEAVLPRAIAHENKISASLNGRSVFDDRKPRSSSTQKKQTQKKQLSLFTSAEQESPASKRH